MSAKTSKVTKTCEHCGVKYESRNLKSRKYCSKSCLNRSFKKKSYYGNDAMKARARKWKKENPEKVRIASRRVIEKLTDGVVRSYIKKRNRDWIGEVTPEMIEERRQKILLKRKLYEIKQQTLASGNHGRTNSVFQGININGHFPPQHAPNHK